MTSTMMNADAVGASPRPLAWFFRRVLFAGVTAAIFGVFFLIFEFLVALSPWPPSGPQAPTQTSVAADYAPQPAHWEVLQLSAVGIVVAFAVFLVTDLRPPPGPPVPFSDDTRCAESSTASTTVPRGVMQVLFDSSREVYLEERAEQLRRTLALTHRKSYFALQVEAELLTVECELGRIELEPLGSGTLEDE